jgi:hypothetical protein
MKTPTATATASPAFGDTAETAFWREIEASVAHSKRSAQITDFPHRPIAILQSLVTGILDATVETKMEDAESAAARIADRSYEMVEGDTIEFCALTGNEVGHGRIRVGVEVLTGSAYEEILERVKAARAAWVEDDLD